MQRTILAVVTLIIAGASAAAQTAERPAGGTTISIVACDSLTGDLGVAVQSTLFASGSIVPYAKTGVGAIATQGVPNASYGMAGIDLLEQGKSSRQTVETLLKSDTSAVSRQLGIVDAQGNGFSYTGANCAQFAAEISGRGYCVQGSGIASEMMLRSIARSFEASSGDLADRLLKALEAGEQAGAVKHARQSGAILVVRDRGGFGGGSDRMIDLRVDDDTVPLVALRRLYASWQKAYLGDVQARSIAMFNEKRNFAASQELSVRMVAALNAQLKEHPDDPEVLNNVARLMSTNNIDRQRALELAKRAAKLAPAKMQYLDTLAECHFQMGHFDEAVAIESELVAKDPGNDTYWKQLKKFKDGKDNSAR